MTSTERWPAVESNPEVLEKFGRDVAGTNKLIVSDIFGLEEELLSMIPAPCLAVILLFPSAGSAKKNKAVAEGDRDPHAFYIEQTPTLTNACGSIAVLHCLANNREEFGVSEDSPCGSYLSRTATMSFNERGLQLDADDRINALHQEGAHQGQTEMQESDDVCSHFICFTASNGWLVELDGAYRDAPRRCVQLGDQSVLQAAAKVIQEEFMTSNEIQFAMLAVSVAEE